MQRSLRCIAVGIVLMLGATPVYCASVILNEYNAVGGNDELDDGDGADSFFGTIEGNGGNWFELLVIDDHVDMRGWQFQWEEDEEVSPGVDAAGTITLSNDDLWTNLRSGSIITLIESSDGGGLNKTQTDVSYDPTDDDWWINISTREEQAKGASALATTTTNDGDSGDFSVGKDDWQLTILDASGGVIFGPVGEGARTWAGGNVNSEEGGSLEGPLATNDTPLTLEVWQAITPSNEFFDDTGSTSFGMANVDYDDVDKTFQTIQDLSALRAQLDSPGPSGDFDGDGQLTDADIDALSAAMRNPPADAQFDVNGDGSVDGADHEMWVTELKNTYFGDANLDGEFNSGDVVSVFRAGKYENGDNQDTGWAEGDWDGDLDFKSGDLVKAFQAGGYEIGPRTPAAAVPEPTSLLLTVIGLMAIALLRRPR